MSNCKIYENQPLKLTATITQNGEALENTLTAAEYRVWKPGTAVGAVPDDTWEAVILDEVTGEIEYDIGENILTPTRKWRYQIYATTGGLEFPAESGNFTVKTEGT